MTHCLVTVIMYAAEDLSLPQEPNLCEMFLIHFMLTKKKERENWISKVIKKKLIYMNNLKKMSS